MLPYELLYVFDVNTIIHNRTITNNMYTMFAKGDIIVIIHNYYQKGT